MAARSASAAARAASAWSVRDLFGKSGVRLLRSRSGFIDSPGTRVLAEQPAAAEAAAAAPLNDLAQRGPSLAQVSAQLVKEIGHNFGIAELGQFSRDGQLRHRY